MASPCPQFTHSSPKASHFEPHTLTRAGLGLLLALILVLGFVTPARADGIIIPDPPICVDRPCPPPPCPGPFPCPVPSPMVHLQIRYHDVNVSIDNQVAVTHVDQVFYNPNDYAVEGTYLFPIPLDAAVTNFTLWVDGKPVEGKVLDAEAARQKYVEIVNSLRDPALLEYAGRGAVQAHIFPIPPRGERRIELEYTQALAAEGGLVRYVYPLSTEKFSLQPLERVQVHVEVRSASPIRAMYSPSHNVAVSYESETHAIAGYEAQNVLPDQDFALFYSVGESEAFHLLSYRDPNDLGDPDGFFLLMLAPRPDAAAQTLAKDMILVLDRSGSMEGEKFQQAQEALRYILRNLNPEDRFNLITFSTGLETYARSLRPADEANEALAWVDRLSAQGSTDINRALLEAAAMARGAERPTYLIFLTDGLPTEGEVDSAKILSNLAAAAPPRLRVFAFGVGYDVDTYLLDSLAQEHHGTSSYVLPGERLDEVISTFYAKISTPVLTDLELNFGDLAAYDLYPNPLPDLFRGSQIILVGRYREGGSSTVTLSGQVDGKEQTFRFTEQAFTRGDTRLTSIPRLWATRKIGYLLNQVRLNGPDQETIDQIVRLSIRYGIVTPFTSYLVTEDTPLGSAEQERIAAEQYNQMESAPTAPVSGQDAVAKAVDQGALAGAEAPSQIEVSASGQVRIVGARTFVFTQDKWIDTAFDPDKMQPQRVAFLSEDYFALAAADPDLAAAFALGQAVIAVVGEDAYEVVPSDEAVPPVQIPTSNPTDPAYPMDTPTPPTPGSPEDPDYPAPADAPFSLPCLAGILPAALFALTALAVSRKR